MVLGRCQVSRSGRIARISIGPDRGSSGEIEVVRATWAGLQVDDSVGAVLVLTVPVDSRAEPDPIDVARPGSLGPKSNGLFKPIGVGVQGVARDEVLQILAEADVILATPDSSFVDTSAAHGCPPIHASALSNMLPQPEVLRLALGGEATAMSATRAADLAFVDSLVSSDELELELERRLTLLLPNSP